MTPYEKLKSIAKTKPYLKPDITYEILNKLVMRISGDESPMQLQIERNKVIQRSLSKIGSRHLRCHSLKSFTN